MTAQPAQPPHGEYMTPEQAQSLAESMQATHCMACKYWDELDSPSWSDGIRSVPPRPVWDGWCRRHPPVIMISLAEHHDLHPATGYWPIARYSDWCGEWEEA